MSDFISLDELGTIPMAEQARPILYPVGGKRYIGTYVDFSAPILYWIAPHWEEEHGLQVTAPPDAELPVAHLKMLVDQYEGAINRLLDVEGETWGGTYVGENYTEQRIPPERTTRAQRARYKLEARVKELQDELGRRADNAR